VVARFATSTIAPPLPTAAPATNASSIPFPFLFFRFLRIDGANPTARMTSSVVEEVVDVAMGNHSELPMGVILELFERDEARRRAESENSEEEGSAEGDMAGEEGSPPRRGVSLVVARNQLETLEPLLKLPEKFQRRVVSFNASFNSLKTSKGCFKALGKFPHCEVLDLSHNPLPKLVPSGNVALLAAGLQVLRLRSCGLCDLPEGMFLSQSGEPRWPGLREVDLYDNKLSDVSELMSLMSLSNLDLSKNQISEIYSPVIGKGEDTSQDESGRFVPLHSRSVVFSPFPANAFCVFLFGFEFAFPRTSSSDGTGDLAFESVENHKYCLINLSLADNQIRELPRFARYGRLETVDLTKNQLRKFGKRMKRDCPRLRLIAAGQNQLDESCWENLVRLPKLQTLDVSYNDIASIPDPALLERFAPNWKQVPWLSLCVFLFLARFFCCIRSLKIVGQSSRKQVGSGKS
jgi:Leucine-rich repeat (LRR) protein